MRKGTTVSLVGALFAAVAVSSAGTSARAAAPSAYNGPEKNLPYTLPAPKLESGFHYKVGFMSAYAAIPALARVIDANRAETQKLGGTFILKDAALSANTQATQLNELINAGVNAIELNPVNPQALFPGLAAARKKGIVIVTHDWPSVAGEHLLPGISTDLLNGRDAATFGIVQAAAKADPGGSYANLQLGLPIPVLQYTLTRMNYWAKRFGLKNLGTVSTTDDTAAGQGNAMTAILSKYPNVTTVLAYSDSAAAAAGSVARASGKANVKVWGNNGEPNVMKQIQAGRVYGTWNADFTSSGRLMAIAVYDLLTHQNLPLPKQIEPGGVVVTKANVGHANPLGVNGPLPPISSRRVAAAKPKLPNLAKLYA